MQKNDEYEKRIYAFYGDSIYNSSWINRKLSKQIEIDNIRRLPSGIDKGRFVVYQNTPNHNSREINLDMITDELVLYDIQLEYGDKLHPYEPYIGETFSITPNKK